MMFRGCRGGGGIPDQSVLLPRSIQVPSTINCDRMTITFLGTGGITGTPAWSCNCKTCRIAKQRKGKNIRTRPSILIESEDKYLIVDTGPDFRTQMLKEKIEKLNYALVTHTHLDHIACLYEMMLGGKMELYIPKEVLKEMKDDFFLRWLLLYIKKRNPEIKIKEFKPFRMGRVKVDSIKLIHQKDFGIKKYPCYGYLFEKK